MLDGLRLTDGGDINIHLHGSLAPFRFYLLERTDDSTISNIPASQIYTGGLSNSGETLLLLDSTGEVLDSANSGGGGWPAGDAASRASMERRGAEDEPHNWGTFGGNAGAGLDAAGNPIAGSPLAVNSMFQNTPTPTSLSTHTPAASLTPTSTPSAPVAPGSVIISEVAWSGTLASGNDEWIELHNQTDQPITIRGWTLSDGGDIHVALSGALGPGGFFLLERTDDTTINDVAADQIYTGNLNNLGERLWLRDGSGDLIDSVNHDGGGWPAGVSATRSSMERLRGAARDRSWRTFTGYHGLGHDAAGNPIHGTPRSTNSVLMPIPTPTAIPARVVINEVLIRPHHDWNENHRSNLNDEFIELYNLGPKAVRLGGWILDDLPDAGSSPYTLPAMVIRPGEHLALFRVRTNISLNDDGDTVRLLAPDDTVVDEIRYLRVKAYNLSYGRMPDGNIYLNYQLWPTPGKPNVFFYEDVPGDAVRVLFPRFSSCPDGGQPWPILPGLARSPALVRWLQGLELTRCHQ